MKSKPESRATYKVPEAAKIAGCGERALRRAISLKHCPHLKFGRNIVIPKAAFHRWIDNCGEGVAAQA